MKERPALFSAPMVLAILEGRKSQTRRIIKPSPPAWATRARMNVSQRDIGWFSDGPEREGREHCCRKCPYGQPGDRLWVRETFQFVHANSDGQRNTFNSAVQFTQNDYRWIEYFATPRDNEPPPKWKPSIFMPRWASRITLEIVSVGMERLQDISEDDGRAEGVEPYAPDDGRFRAGYAELWDSINGKGSWDKNPWVWVISFRRIKP